MFQYFSFKGVSKEYRSFTNLRDNNYGIMDKYNSGWSSWFHKKITLFSITLLQGAWRDNCQMQWLKLWKRLEQYDNRFTWWNFCLFCTISATIGPGSGPINMPVPAPLLSVICLIYCTLIQWSNHWIFYKVNTYLNISYPPSYRSRHICMLCTI